MLEAAPAAPGCSSAASAASKPDLKGDLKERQEAEEIARLQLRDKPVEFKAGLNRRALGYASLPPRLAPRVVFNEGDRHSPKVAPGVVLSKMRQQSGRHNDFLSEMQCFIENGKLPSNAPHIYLCTYTQT